MFPLPPNTPEKRLDAALKIVSCVGLFEEEVEEDDVEEEDNTEEAEILAVLEVRAPKTFAPTAPIVPKTPAAPPPRPPPCLSPSATDLTKLMLERGLILREEVVVLVVFMVLVLPLAGGLEVEDVRKVDDSLRGVVMLVVVMPFSTTEDCLRAPPPAPPDIEEDGIDRRCCRLGNETGKSVKRGAIRVLDLLSMEMPDCPDFLLILD